MRTLRESKGTVFVALTVCCLSVAFGAAIVAVLPIVDRVSVASSALAATALVCSAILVARAQAATGRAAALRRGHRARRPGTALVPVAARPRVAVALAAALLRPHDTLYDLRSQELAFFVRTRLSQPLDEAMTQAILGGIGVHRRLLCGVRDPGRAPAPATVVACSITTQGHEHCGSPSRCTWPSRWVRSSRSTSPSVAPPWRLRMSWTSRTSRSA